MYYGLCENGELQKEVLLLVYCPLKPSCNHGFRRACLHGVGDPGLVELVSFAFTLWGTQNKRNLPH